ncbi:hypothetical protein JCM10914A_51280 [Paenibacillus sp. JCM 10914]|uniref:hypothetical protein n=1 Tax=Paenibacillus sp. JCM 10914 TaxID=1236974 RepID=UPI0003CC88EE|nr:hypothetical protein [Paenibacillus sp. JCM 10914]GAE05173.1 hypothetical protein JCM10914_1263 [Paenibacillus sp. JCM 10914]
MRSIFGISLLFVCILMIGCAALTQEPPSAAGQTGDQKIPFLTGSNEWNHAVADAPSPDDLVKDQTYHEVEPNAEMTFEFNGTNPRQVKVAWWEGHETHDLTQKDDAFVLPSEPGKYVLLMWGEWPNNGRVSYVTAIEVKE